MSSEIVPVFMTEKESLLAMIEEPLNQYLLARMKRRQLIQRKIEAHVPEVIKSMEFHAAQILLLLTQDIENETNE